MQNLKPESPKPYNPYVSSNPTTPKVLKQTEKAPPEILKLEIVGTSSQAPFHACGGAKDAPDEMKPDSFGVIGVIGFWV